MAAPLSDAAVGDRRFGEVDAGRAVEIAKVIGAPEGAVFIDRLGPDLNCHTAQAANQLLLSP